MPFPVLGCPPEQTEPACCSKLWDQGEMILETVAGPVLACQGDITPCAGNRLRGFVSLGRPEGWLFDFVAVWLEGFALSSKSQAASGVTNYPPDIRALWRIQLMESNYPGLKVIGGTEESPIYATPTDDEFHAANRHGYSHGEALFRGVMQLVGCGGFILRDFGPVQPVNYSAGWTIGLGLDVTF